MWESWKLSKSVKSTSESLNFENHRNPHKNKTNYENLRNPRDNYKNNENFEIPNENNENHESLRNLCED